MSMENIESKYDEKTGVLTLKIDTRKNLGPSKSGKSDLIATTNGAETVAGAKLNLNFYKSK